MRRKLLLSFCLLMLAFAARGTEPLNSIIAIVNDEAITALEVAHETVFLRETNPAADDDDLNHLALNALIERRLLLQRAEIIGVAVPDDMVAAQLNRVRENLQIPDEATLKRHVEEQYGISYAQFTKRMRDELNIEGAFYSELYRNTRIYDEEVEQYLKENAPNFKKRQIHLAHILVDKTDNPAVARQQAEKIRDRALAGEDFSALARDFSAGENVANGGDLGMRTEEELPSAFVNAVQNLTAGTVAPLLETSRGFHILKVLDVDAGGMQEKVERVRLSHIFLPLKDRQQAQTVYRELGNRALEYDEAVRRYSTDKRSIDRGGDLGWFVGKDVPPYFQPAVANMREGDFSPPIESPFGWHILLLGERRTDAVDITSMRQQARQILQEERARRRYAVWLQNIRSQAHIRIVHPDYLPLDQ